MKKETLSVSATVALLAASAFAHFQVLEPTTDIAGQDSSELNIRAVFTHPMENGPAMEMGKPSRFGVMLDGKTTDLSGSLETLQVDGKTAYEVTYELKQPGDHIFFIEPEPYWEPAEQKMIIHYTKVIVNAFNGEGGWDEAVGFPVEIEPLVRPYGLWTGNTFRGVVRKDGKPVPHAEIEVEYLNRDANVKPPADAFVTQVIKADGNGVFSYTMPKAGWWAFAALIDGEPMENPEGKTVDTELGALIWIHCVDMK